jgi:hypothetical protein
MDNVNVFEQAARRKLRFGVPNGASITAEDLWDLPLTSKNGRANLDDLARDLHRQLKAVNDEVSFVEPTSNKKNEELNIGFELVKQVIAVRVEERRVANEREDRAKKKQQLLEVLSRKENAELEGKSADELRAMVNAL